MLPQGSKASFHSHFFISAACKIHCKRITPNDSQTDMQNTNASHSMIRLNGLSISS